jgi:hypothetical protein
MEPLAWYQIVAPTIVCLILVLVALATQRPRLRFAAIGLVAMVGYGMLQDQLSARLCPDYFTVFHPPIPGVTDPTLLGVAWGFLGAWWGGVLLGYIAGLVATLGSRPPVAPRELVRPLVVLLLVVGLVVLLTGINVWRHAELLGVSLDPALTKLVPPERHRPLLIVACYHFAAYASATIGGVVLCVWVWVERVRRTEKGSAT